MSLYLTTAYDHKYAPPVANPHSLCQVRWFMDYSFCHSAFLRLSSGLWQFRQVTAWRSAQLLTMATFEFLRSSVGPFCNMHTFYCHLSRSLYPHDRNFKILTHIRHWPDVLPLVPLSFPPIFIPRYAWHLELVTPTFRVYNSRGLI